jgi:tetratricopeptide (TPR) repeat protein
LGNLGNIYRARGDDTRALKYLQLCRNARVQSGDRQGLAICLNNLAQVQSFRGEYRAAEDTTRNALETFQQIGDPKGTLIAACNLAAWLVPLGSFQEARELLIQERPRAHQLALPPIAAHIDWNMGMLLTALGSYDEADGVILQGLRELPSEKLGGLRSQLLCALAEVHIEIENLEIAEDCLREATELMDELKMREGKADLARLRARLNTNRGAPDEALALCLSRLEQGGWDALGTALLHCETGRAYRELGPDWSDRTEQHLTLAIESFERMANPHRKAEAQFELGRYWRLCGEEDEANALFEDASTHLMTVGATLRARRFQQLGRTQ